MSSPATHSLRRKCVVSLTFSLLLIAAWAAFGAATPAAGQQPFPVADIAPGAGSIGVLHPTWAAVGNRLYLVLDDGAHGPEVGHTGGKSILEPSLSCP